MESWRSEFKIGARISGKYELTSHLGRGAQGTVFKAIQHPVGRDVAVKFISRHHSQDHNIRSRFFREARALARLNHPSVVTLFDYGEAEGELFMVMEFVEGEELYKIIERSAPVDPVRVMRISQHILSALIDAHDVGLVHRDLKPSNVMVFKGASGEERIKILDFGISHVYEERTELESHYDEAIGTPTYCAPEQSLGKHVGPSADLYSLGVILFELLSGKPPYSANSSWMIIDQHRRAPIPSFEPHLNVPTDLEALVQLAMAKEPKSRFPDARSMATRLIEILDNYDRSSSFCLPTLRDLQALDSATLAHIAQQLGHRASDAFATNLGPTDAGKSHAVNGDATMGAKDEWSAIKPMTMADSESVHATVEVEAMTFLERHPEIANQLPDADFDDGPTQKPKSIPPVSAIETSKDKKPKKHRASDVTVEEKIEDWENRD